MRLLSGCTLSDGGESTRLTRLNLKILLKCSVEAPSTIRFVRVLRSTILPPYTCKEKGEGRLSGEKLTHDINMPKKDRMYFDVKRR